MKELIFKLHSDVLESNPNVNFNTNGGNIMDNVKMFNFKENWNLVEPHLNKPEILELLNTGMRGYCADNPFAVRLDWDKDGHKGPWLFSIGDCWNFTNAKRFFESKELTDLMSNYETLADEAGVDFNEIMCADPKELPLDSLGMHYWNDFHKLYDSLCPQPNSYEWYQCLGAEKHLAPWQQTLAEKIFPEYRWKIVEMNETESFFPVMGIGPNGEVLFFDIFSFEQFSSLEIMKSAGAHKRNCSA